MEASKERDYFTDHDVLIDPYTHFEDIRPKGPVHWSESRDLVMVTGFAEAIEILRNAEDFSSIVTVSGPLVPLPFTAEGDDISDQIETHYAELAGPDLLVSKDGTQHTAYRSLLNRLFVPSRLKANEEFMLAYADQLAREVVAKGECDLINEIATPYVTLVIADLLGVPAEDREKFREVIDSGPTAGDINKGEEGQDMSSLIFMGGFFLQYLQDRRANPREDVLTQLATATLPDGSLPDLIELVKLATFLFAAGQDTSAKLLGNSLRAIAEAPELQQQLRNDRSLITPFVEEMLRLEGSSKTTFRLAKRKTQIGGFEIPAGAKVVIALAAANRDPRRWESPAEFQFNRPKIVEHLAFGRGAHTCAGAPLARIEVRVMLERLLEYTSNIGLSEAKHGPAGNRRFDYEPSFIIRGLSALHLDLTPS